MQRLGDYELIRRLATGGMGEVFLARRGGAGGIHKQVVLKRIFPQFRDNPEYRRLFVREAKVTSRLVHPNIVQVFDLGEQERELFLAMEYVPGCDLQSLIKNAWRSGAGLPNDVLALVAYDLLDALDHAHTALDETGRPLGIIHHDVSPQNVLVSVDGFCKLCDFGIARIQHDTGTNFASIRGKFAYAAPEQIAGERLDARADLFSLGVVLYEALTGKRLYDVGNLLERRERDSATATQLQLVAPANDPALVEIIAEMLRADPRERTPSAAAARDALEPVLLRMRPRAARQALAELVRRHTAPDVDVTDVPKTQLSHRWRSLLDRSPLDVPGRGHTLVLAPEALEDVSETPAGDDETPELEPDATLAVDRPTMPSAAAPRRKPRMRISVMAAGAALVAGLAVAYVGPRDPEPAPSPPPSPPTAPRAELAPPPPENPPPPPETASEEPTQGVAKAKRKEVRGFLSINANPWAYVTVNGVRLPKTTPVRKHPLAPGRYTVELEGPDGERRRLSVEVRAGQTTTELVRFDEPRREPAP